MTEETLVSVVIPAYQAEATLARALESVLAQSWHNLQVIVVDDGSRDGTLAVAREAAKRDDRVQVLTQANAGVSAARNLGLAACRGTWICFVDADDTLPADSVAIRVRQASRNRAQLVIGGYTEYVGPATRFKNLAKREATLSFEEILPELSLHANSYFYGVLWNKLFARSVLEKTGAAFGREFTWGEDFAFVMDYLQGVDRVAYMKESVYDYRRNPESATIRQVLDSVVHPLGNIRTKRQLYGHLKALYVARGAFPAYRHRLWHYLFRVGLS